MQVINFSKHNQMLYSVKTQQYIQSSAFQYAYVFRSLPTPSSGQHLSVNGTISVHHTLLGPILFTEYALKQVQNFFSYKILIYLKCYVSVGNQ